MGRDGRITGAALRRDSFWWEGRDGGRLWGGEEEAVAWMCETPRGLFGWFTIVDYRDKSIVHQMSCGRSSAPLN